MNRAFTLIEILASLLVLSLGMAAAIGLSSLALRRAEEGRAESLALPTALSALQDVDPMLPDATIGDWTTSTNGDTTTSTGYMNGFWVRRIETRLDTISGLTPVDIQVEISLPSRPEPSVRLRTRMLRAKP
jgi:prepilin-type N-terminal cleavage/methylation domain-containing protein